MKHSDNIFKFSKQSVSEVLELSQLNFIGLAAIAGAAMLMPSDLKADTITYWGDWTLPGNEGYTIPNTSGVSSTYMSGASGSINNNGTIVTLGLTGEVNIQSSANATDWYGSVYNPAGAYTDSTGTDNVGNGPNGEDRIAQTGYTTPGDIAHTLTFGGTVQQDVVMAIWSLGNPSNVSSLLFTQDFEILSSDRMTKNITPNGYELEGYEGAGIIQFLGSYTSISWTVTAPEFYSAFNVGITSNPVTTTAGAVLSIPQAMRDIDESTDVHTGLGSVTTYAFDGGILTIGSNLSDDFSIKAGGGSVRVNTGDTFTMSGVISSAVAPTTAFGKLGAGRLILTGDNTYTNDTTVAEGILQLDGSLASQIIVYQGATLSGGGRTTGNLQSHGVLAPGNSPGTLTFVGDGTFAATNTFEVEIDGRVYNAAGGAGSYDRLVFEDDPATTATVEGNVVVDGSIDPILRNISGSANNDFDPVLGDIFTVITAETSVSGTFSSVTQPTDGMPANTRFDVLYGATQVDLVLTPDSYEVFAATNGGYQNMVNGAAALDDIRPAAGADPATDAQELFERLYPLSSTDLFAALAPLSGEIHVFALNDIRDSVNSFASSSYLGGLSGQAEGQHLWMDVSGTRLSYPQDLIASQYESDLGNIWLGYDIEQRENLRYGLAIGHSRSEVTGTVAGEASSSTTMLMGYYANRVGDVSFSSEFGLGRSTFDTTRSVALSGGTETATSSADVDVAFLNFGAIHHQPVSDSIEGGLWVDLTATYLSVGSYTESGSALINASASSETFRSGSLSMGYQLDFDVTPEGSNDRSSVTLGLGFVRDIGNDSRYTRNLSMHNASWEVATHDLNPNSVFATLGADFTLANGGRVTLAATGQGNGDYTRFGASANFSISW